MISIGRDASCDVVLTDDGVSRLHCEIVKKYGKYEIKDLSKNGISINNKKAVKEFLRDGDQIKIGGWTAYLQKSKTPTNQVTVAKSDESTKIIEFDGSKKILTLEALDLTIKSASGNKLHRTFKQSKITIGSSESNDVIIKDDDYISKKHCRLTVEDSGIILTDLGSTNGTFYESEKVEKIVLPGRSKFTIGKTEISVKKVQTKEKLKPEKENIGSMIGATDSIKGIFALISRVAQSDATVCITGESGTGKELVAKSVHDMGSRASNPFVAINCGAIPPNIIESELFGHEKGAFTGATNTHRGVFEQASMGTLFLDEIGEMPPDLQTRLLRVLETRTIRRIGGQRDIPVDVRIVAATNQNLKQNVARGKFREDLFFRIHVIPIHIPPLRERKKDIEVLAEHFVKMFCPDGEEKNISSGAMNKLLKHSWPGNVRELKNTIQRALVMNQGNVINLHDIHITELKDTHGLKNIPLISKEKEAIIEALRKSSGNQLKASRILGIARTTLSNKINKYEIDMSIFKMA